MIMMPFSVVSGSSVPQDSDGRSRQTRTIALRKGSTRASVIAKTRTIGGEVRRFPLDDFADDCVDDLSEGFAGTGKHL